VWRVTRRGEISRRFLGYGDDLTGQFIGVFESAKIISYCTTDG
jgi:hypothetical protein